MNSHSASAPHVGKNLRKKEKKAETTLGSAGLTARATLSETETGPEHIHGEEVEFGVQRTLDVLRLTEPVLLV